MVFFGGEVALLLGVLGALGQFLAALMGRRLGAVARRSLLPVLDLLRQRGLVGVVARGHKLALLGCGLHHSAADGLGLEERPQVGGFNILGDRFGLCALAER